jgi:hypothetical protein
MPAVEPCEVAVKYIILHVQDTIDKDREATLHQSSLAAMLLSAARVLDRHPVCACCKRPHHLRAIPARGSRPTLCADRPRQRRDGWTTNIVSGALQVGAQRGFPIGRRGSRDRRCPLGLGDGRGKSVGLHRQQRHRRSPLPTRDPIARISIASLWATSRGSLRHLMAPRAAIALPRVAAAQCNVGLGPSPGRACHARWRVLFQQSHSKHGTQHARGSTAKTRSGMRRLHCTGRKEAGWTDHQVC